MSTKTNEAAQERSIDDGVIQLRRWGTDLVYMLPSWSLDAARGDSTSRTRELGGKAGLQLDGGRLDWFGLQPCTEVGIGGTTLIAESGRSIELRRFLGRILGWSHDRLAAVDLALRAIRMAATRRAALVLYGQEDLVPIAHALHRRAIGADRPFVVCDPRRQDVGESVRAAANYKRAVDAVGAAVGGSLCVRDARLPRDFGQVQEQLRDPETRVQLIVCADKRRRRSAFLAPFIEVPPITKRKEELGRIVDEYTLDALAELGEPRTSFTSADHDWVLAHEATSFASIERATLRLIALRTSRNVSRAVATLADLRQWSQLGVEIADLGEHRLKIAGRAARVAAAGGLGVSAEEEAGIADWFRGIVQTAIERGGVRAARAIWFVLVSDNQRDPRGGWTPRCSALETIVVPPTRIEGIEPTEADEQEIATWLAEFPDVAASYVHHAMACATTEDVTELRRLIHADDDALDAIYAPEPLALAEHDPHEAMYEAMSVLTRRRLDNAQASGALENWAFGSQNAVQEHAWEPPVRIGICAWLARVALRHEEQAA